MYVFVHDVGGNIMVNIAAICVRVAVVRYFYVIFSVVCSRDILENYTEVCRRYGCERYRPSVYC